MQNIDVPDCWADAVYDLLNRLQADVSNREFAGLPAMDQNDILRLRQDLEFNGVPVIDRLKEERERGKHGKALKAMLARLI